MCSTDKCMRYFKVVTEALLPIEPVDKGYSNKTNHPFKTFYN